MIGRPEYGFGNEFCGDEGTLSWLASYRHQLEKRKLSHLLYSDILLTIFNTNNIAARRKHANIIYGNNNCNKRILIMALVVTPPPNGYGRLRFVTDANSIIATMIRWETMTSVASHCEAVFADCIIGSYEDGVRKQTLDFDTSSTSQIFVDIPMTKPVLSSWRRHLEDKIGSPYDYEAIVGFIAHQSFHAEGHFICSHLQVQTLRECKVIRHRLNVPYWEVSPRDLLLMMAAMPDAVIHPPQTGFQVRNALKTIKPQRSASASPNKKGRSPEKG